MSAPALPGEVTVARDPIDVAARAAAWLVERSAGASSLAVAFSGGSTPRFLLEALATSSYRTAIDWARWHVYFADERAVPPDHEESNYRLVHDALLAKVAVPGDQVHRMEAERHDLDAAADDYARLLATARDEPPRLDVILLGIGDDGHTASLFPGTPALGVTTAWATRGRAPRPPHDRITLTLPTINAADDVAFVVTGSGKADALRGVLTGTVPAARVRPATGGLRWFLDAAAADAV